MNNTQAYRRDQSGVHSSVFRGTEAESQEEKRLCGDGTRPLDGIVNLFFSPDEFSPLRGFLGLFHGDSSRKETQRTSLFPTFREK